ncbi:MAG: hypothetical protein NT004_00210 [Bacteroidetes bacterium]|nr:hypothetical protein [Bacteroidota bacterium]
MKTMKNSITRNLRFAVGFLTVMLISVTSGYAQDNPMGKGKGKASPEDRAKRQTEMMKENLKLTPAQEPKVAAINLKYAKKNEEARKITDTTLQRTTLQGNNKLKETELKGILTPEQLKTYQKQVAEMKARRKGKAPKSQP